MAVMSEGNLSGRNKIGPDKVRNQDSQQEYSLGFDEETVAFAARCGPAAELLLAANTPERLEWAGRVIKKLAGRLAE
jgi:hypothetical protein